MGEDASCCFREMGTRTYGVVVLRPDGSIWFPFYRGWSGDRVVYTLGQLIRHPWVALPGSVRGRPSSSSHR